MASLNKPSTPIINDDMLSVDPVPGAVQYALYKVRYIATDDNGQKYILADGKIIVTDDEKEFRVEEEEPASE